MQQAGPYLAASWTLTAGVLIGALGGSWLDKKLGSSPWLVLIGTFLGVAIGLYQLAVVALKPGRGTK